MKASLRVAHSRSCPNRERTTPAGAPTSKTRNGCTCRPAYYTFHRQPVGSDAYKPVKGERVHDRKTAESDLSLRYTTSNVMQRRGYHPRLIEATLGHSNLELTYGVYGGWTPDQLAAEAGRVTRPGAT
jgi:hypothetical protein